MHLGEHAPAGGGGLVEQTEVLAPDVRHAATAEDPERHRAPGLDGEIAQADVVIAQPRIVRRPVHALPGDLEEPGVQLAHDADQPPHFVPRRQTARDVTPVGSLVSRRS